METLRGFRQKCRVKVRILSTGEEKVAKILFGECLNFRPVEDDVHLEPYGWFKTDDVELLDVLVWKE